MAKRASLFAPSTAEERRLISALKGVSKETAAIVARFTDADGLISKPAAMNAALKKYAKALKPWATTTFAATDQRVARRNLSAFNKMSRQLGAARTREIASVGIGSTTKQLLTEQVGLIQSLPVDAGLRAQKLSLEATTTGLRADEIAREIARTGEVTASRAQLIARTEIAKANTAYTQARCEAVDIDRYVWTTMGDAAVRETHAELDGQIFSFDDPPDIDGEGVHGPGEFPNCRCYASPLVLGDKRDLEEAA